MLLTVKQLIFFNHSSVSLHISLFKQCIYNSAYLIYKWGPGICSLFMQSNLKTSVARVRPDTAEQPAGKKPQSCLSLPPIIFCPTASAAKRVEQISPGSAELSVLPSLSCQQPPTRQVPDDWLTTEAGEWWNCWLASACSELQVRFSYNQLIIRMVEIPELVRHDMTAEQVRLESLNSRYTMKSKLVIIQSAFYVIVMNMLLDNSLAFSCCSCRRL